MKKYIIGVSLLAIVGIGGGYWGASLTNPTTTNEIASVEPFDKAKELGIIHNLIKTYISSSVKLDWETILVLSSGEYEKQLNEKIIPQSKESKQMKYDFNPRSLKIDVKSITPDQSIVEVTYIVSHGEGKETTESQETLTVYLGKENNHWSIVKVEVPQ